VGRLRRDRGGAGGGGGIGILNHQPSGVLDSCDSQEPHDLLLPGQRGRSGRSRMAWPPVRCGRWGERPAGVLVEAAVG
jgi:hypothetical protein